MSSLSDHAYSMHLHLYPTLHSSICLSSLSLVRASARSGQELLYLFFCRPRFSRAMMLNSGIPRSMVATPGFALVQGKNCNYRLLLLRATRFPMAWASTKGFSISLHEASRQSLYPWLPPWGKSLVVRWAVFQHAVSHVAGTKIGFKVIFLIKSINSPTNDLNAFS